MVNSATSRQAHEGPTSLAEALGLIDRIYQPPLGMEGVPVQAARGRVLARPVAAKADLPPFDRAAVDGFALRRADLNPSDPTRLQVIGHVAAGHQFLREVGKGQAVRILTGAPMAAGADLVVMQEHCIHGDEIVVIAPQAGGRSNVRRRGEDCAAGNVALAAGTRLGPGEIALAAALGHGALQVYRQVKVALFSTGDELREAGESLRPAQIVDANRPLLAAMLEGYGCEVTDGGILPDRADRVIAALALVAATHDLIVTSGGVSLGDEDHVAKVIRRRGYLESWRLKVKPGKPVAMGDVDDCPILALPGNPVAAAALLALLGRPIIARLAGATEAWPKPLRLSAGFNFEKKRDFVECWPARLRPGTSVVELMSKRGSAMLSSLAGAEGFAVLEAGRDRLEPGDPVDFLPLF